MKRTNRNYFLITGILFLLFGIFTATVLWVDVQPIGPENTSVGLASVNRFIFEQLGVHLLWYHITDWLGVIAILFAFGFAVVGLIQLITRKSLFKVDYQIIALGVFYALVVAVYVFFEIAIVNYRPIILHTAPEASYPSSHTMIVICIMATAMMEFHRLLDGRKTALLLLDGISLSIMAVTVIGRLLSGVHWFTDIIAGLLLSAALVMLYTSAVRAIGTQPGK